jgi:hypothetical protein
MKKYTTNWKLRGGLAALALGAVALHIGCNDNSSSSSSNSTPPPAQPGTTSLFDKYGGQPTIRKIVDDLTAALIIDCTQNPYFTQDAINFDNVDVDGQGHGSNGFDTLDRLKSCFDAQFTAIFGGPSQYTGAAAVSVPSRTIPNQNYECQDMQSIHAGLGIPADVFDQFMTDAGAVLRKDGISNADVNTIAQALVGFKPQIVTTGIPREFDFQPGDPEDQPALACRVNPRASVSPSPSPSVSPSPNPSPSITPTPSPSVSPSPGPSPSMSPSSGPSGGP